MESEFILDTHVSPFCPWLPDQTSCLKMFVLYELLAHLGRPGWLVVAILLTTSGTAMASCLTNASSSIRDWKLPAGWTECLDKDQLEYVRRLQCFLIGVMRKPVLLQPTLKGKRFPRLNRSERCAGTQPRDRVTTDKSW